MTQTTKLSERAMIVHLKLSAWLGQRVDKKVTKEVLAQQHAAHDAGRFSKYLVPPTALEPVQQAQTHARNRHNKLTLAWGDNARILTIDTIFSYRDAMEEERVICEGTYDVFSGVYPALKADAPRRLNGMFLASDFPDETLIRRRFGFKLRVLPVPEKGDFRIESGDDELQADLQKSVEESIADFTRDAQKDLWERLRETVEHFTLTMLDPKKKFKDTTVSNMLDMATFAPKLSLERNGKLHQVCTEIIKFNMVSPTSLRKSPATRKRAAEEAKNILSQINKALA